MAQTRFGLTTLTCVVIASMIGSGVFTTSGYTLATLGSPQRVVIAWLIGGLVAICGSIAYGELAHRLPVSGGEYLYLSRRLHPFFGFLSGWVSLTAGFSGAIAVAALVFEGYLRQIVDLSAWPSKTVAMAVIGICGVGHSFLVRPFAAIQNAVVVIKLAVLLGLLAMAASRISTHTWHWDATPTEADKSVFALIMAFGSSVMWISLSFAGFNAAIYIASEVRDPERTIPLSLWIGTTIVTCFYVCLNLVFVTATPAKDILLQEDIAAIAANAIGGQTMKSIVIIAVCMGTATSVAGMIMTGPRVFARMADDGFLPAWLRTGEKSTQRNVMLQTLIALGIVHLGTVLDLIKYLGTILTLSSALAVATLLIRRSPGTSEEPKPGLAVRVAAILYVSTSLVTAVLMACRDIRDLAATAITLGAGTVLWLLMQPAPSSETPRT